MMRIIPMLLVYPLLLGAASRDFVDNDRVSAGDVNNVTTGNLTLCVWVKTTEDASVDTFVMKRANQTTATAGYSLWQLSTDTPGFGAGDGAQGVVNSSSGDIIDGVWSWLCGTWTASSEVSTIYNNSVQTDTDTGGGSIDSLTNTNNFAFGLADDGTLDAVALMAYGRFHNEVLSLVRITESQWFPERVTDSISGLWPLWGDATEPDISGAGLSGTVTVGSGGTSEDGPPVIFGGGLPL